MSFASPAPRQSERFNAEDAEVVFQSSDNVLFAIYRKHLESNTGAFPPAEIVADKAEVVHLQESSATLDILFQFIYPQRHPSLSDTTFDVLAPLAEAAEKYEVFSAMNICHIRMLKFLERKEHAERIMSYAAKHGYREVVDAAAPLVVAMSIGSVVQILPQHLHLPWVLYREQWKDILQTALKNLGTNDDHQCSDCKRLTNLIYSLDVKALSTPMTVWVGKTIQDTHCRYCNVNKFDQWAKEVDNMKESIDPCSKFF